jgi:hypothetical protein
VKKMIRSAKRKFEKRLADGYSVNSRPFYSYIKKKTKSRPSIGPLKDKNEKVVTEDQEMAKVLNEFFSSVFTRENTTNVSEAENMATEEIKTVRITSGR